MTSKQCARHGQEVVNGQRKEEIFRQAEGKPTCPGKEEDAGVETRQEGCACQGGGQESTGQEGCREKKLY
ncbi:MAG: hypothetical protein IPM80_18015 [Proteobacteria bacterium]|nr:hypothetical protein [Pseudomonadota bacterium]